MKTILVAILAVLAVALAGVFGYQKLSQPETSPIAVNQSKVNQPANNQPQENKQCIAEGEDAWTAYWDDSTDTIYKAVCCSGLIALNAKEYLGADGVCYAAGGDGRTLCTKCGNGVCGPRESACICPQDCGEPAFVKYNYRKIVNKNAGPWQTYKNEQYGFEMKYPVNWHVYPSNLQGIIIGFSNLSEEEVQARQEAGDVTNMYSLTVKIINGQIDSYLQEQQRFSEALKIDFLKEKIIIGENEGYKISSTFEGKKGFSKVLFAKEKVYLIETLFPEECRYEECEIFSQILSTFKFVK